MNEWQDVKIVDGMGEEEKENKQNIDVILKVKQPPVSGSITSNIAAAEAKPAAVSLNLKKVTPPTHHFLPTDVGRM